MHYEGGQYGEGKGGGDTYIVDQSRDGEKENGEGEGTGEDATEDAARGRRSLKSVGESAENAGEDGKRGEQAA